MSIARDKLFKAPFSLGLLRNHMAQFLTEMAGLTRFVKALYLSQYLPADDMKQLYQLPIGGKSSLKLIADFANTARVAVPLA